MTTDSAVIEIQGRDIHPGYAKSIMINSIRVMSDIITRLPKNMAPETTAGYEPYLHPLSLEGGVFKNHVQAAPARFQNHGTQTAEKDPRTHHQRRSKALFQSRNHAENFRELPKHA